MPLLNSAFPSQLLSERVPAIGTDIVFLALNFLLKTVLRFAAQITNNHDLSPLQTIFTCILRLTVEQTRWGSDWRGHEWEETNWLLLQANFM